MLFLVVGGCGKSGAVVVMVDTFADDYDGDMTMTRKIYLVVK